MTDIVQWMKDQGVGISAHKAFRRRAREIAARNPDQAAMWGLLVAMSKRFTNFYDDVALPIDIATASHRKLVKLVSVGIDSLSLSVADRFDVLNAIARDNLLEVEPHGEPRPLR